MINVDDKDIALCIDCDGTLVRSDLLHEGLLHLIKQSPYSLLVLPFWLLRGKAFFKERVAERVTFDWATLPYCPEILSLIRKAKASGRPVLLVTASPRKWAAGISLHLGLFDSFIATEDGINLSGERKAQYLTRFLGEKRFDYAGNALVDVPVWSASRYGIVVSSNPSLIEVAQKSAEISQVILIPQAKPQTYVRALRLHQWLKNLLIPVPLLAAHGFMEVDKLLSIVVAFLSFSLCASAVYVINDLLDLDADRVHTRKRTRPFASGLVPVWKGVLIVPCLLSAALVMAFYLPLSFLSILGTYFLLTMAYSVRLKRQVIVDVLLLAALYTMRIIAGAAAIVVIPSFWMLAFSMFMFLSLAIVKRYSELFTILRQQKAQSVGRGYSVSDLPILASLGSSAGMCAVLVLALYINDPETANLYPQKMFLWLVPPLILYWVSRVWLKTCRGEIDDDPVVFAISDWQSLLVGFVLLVCFVLAASQPGLF